MIHDSNLGGAGAGCGFTTTDTVPPSLSFPLSSASVVEFFSFFFFLTILKLVNISHYFTFMTMSKFNNFW